MAGMNAGVAFARLQTKTCKRSAPCRARLVDAWSTVSNKQSEADFVKLLIALARDRFGNNVTEAVVEDNDDLNNTEFLQERDFKKACRSP